MSRRLVSQEVRGLVAVLAAAVFLTGCYSMARVQARYVTTDRPTMVVVRDADGAIFAVNNPAVVGDSLVGMSDANDHLSLNLREVDAMVVRKFSKPKTYGLVGGLVGVTGLVVAGAVMATTANDCPRIANRNSQCIADVSGCKYGGCTDGNAF